MQVPRAIVLASGRVMTLAAAVLVGGCILCPAEANDLSQRRSGWYTGWGFGPFEMRLVRLVAPVWGNPPSGQHRPQTLKGGPGIEVTEPGVAIYGHAS